MKKYVANRLAAVLLAVFTAPGLHAQPTEPATSGYAGHRAQHGHMHGDPAQRAEKIRQKQAQLHARLGLDNAQEAAWKAYVARMQPNSIERSRPSREQLAAMSVPERMEQRLAGMQAVQQRMTERLAATREFYAVLSPEQQKIFNEHFPLRGGKHMHHRG